MTDLARLDRICSALPADDAAWLRDLLEPRWRHRQRRLAERDALLREMGGQYILLGNARPIARAVRNELLRRASRSALRIIELSVGQRVPSDRIIRQALAGIGQHSPLSAAHDLPDTDTRSGAARG